MKKQAAIACILFAAPIMATSANWIAIAGTEWPVTPESKVMIEVDLPSVRRREGYRQAWVRYNHNPPNQTPNGKPVGSTVQLTLFDCKNEESSSTNYLEYTKSRGEGENVLNNQQTRQEAIKSMSAAVPGSFGETVLHWVCSRQL